MVVEIILTKKATESYANILINVITDGSREDYPVVTIREGHSCRTARMAVAISLNREKFWMNDEMKT